MSIIKEGSKIEYPNPTETMSDNNEQKVNEVCGHNCSCTNGEDCHSDGVLNYFELHEHKRSFKEDYPHENGEYVNICHVCNNQFVGHKRRVTCKMCQL